MATLRPTIAELCARYHNENAHTEHVARLALDLFDATRDWLEFTEADRLILEAAARLHDVGYSLNPARHAAVSAELVAEQGLRGVRPPRLRAITTIMPLHAGDWGDHLPAPRLARLAAVLRIADGLDHGHIQDATVQSVACRGCTLRVAVHSPWFPYNLTRAELKADLWRAVCPYQIHFVPARSGARAPLVAATVAPLEAARRLLSLQFKQVLINAPGSLQPTDSEPLHDLRVALRRLRMLLRTFHKQLPKRIVKTLLADWGELGTGLGPARDHDVWIDFLNSPAVRAQLGSSPVVKRFVKYHAALRELDQVTVQRHLRGPRFRSLRQRTARLLRAEFPRLLAAKPPAAPLATVARKKYHQACAKILKQAKLRRSQSPAKLHKLRVTMRRARYLGEFFAPVLSPAAQRQTKRIKRAEQLLGRIHDLDLSLARLHVEGPPPPRALTRLLQAERAQCLAEINRAWKRMKLKP